MINPSIHGWIDKFFLEQNFDKHEFCINDIDFYSKTKATGFIFGHIINFDVPNPITTKGRLPEEVSKIGLLSSLFQLYRLERKNNHYKQFIKEAVSFYKLLKPKGFNPLKMIMGEGTPSSNLETIIHERVQTNEDLFSKTFSHVLTNALLFIDVLAFKHYLEKGELPEKYFIRIEELSVSIVSLSLKIKTGKSVHDELLQKLFDSSVRYSKSAGKSLKSLDDYDVSYFSNHLEKLYIIDLAGISLWSDEKVENEERFFMFKLGERLHINDELILKSIDFVNAYISKYKSHIPYFNNSNPVKNFYDKTTETVEVLINRNKKRLIKELSQSKELMQLLAKSTHTDLDKKEKKKIKNQLLDICKTVPSLTIFLLPGGSLLLPILIKFIPKMLPSAFNENIDDQ